MSHFLHFEIFLGNNTSRQSNVCMHKRKVPCTLEDPSVWWPQNYIWAFCRRCGFDGFIRLLTLTLAGAVDSQMWSGWDENQHLQIWDDDPQSGKGEVTFPGRGWEPAPKWRSSIKSGSSRVRGGWKGRSTGGSELSWMRKISITGWAWFPPSPMVMICGLRPKEQDHGFKWPKLIFFASRGASWGGWGIGLGCLVDAPLMRCSRHNPMGRDIKKESRHAGKTTSLGWRGHVWDTSE